MSTVRVLISDDHPVYRDGMRGLVESAADMEVVGEAATGEEAVAQARALQPDVVLMDVKMPEINGIEATRIILGSGLQVGILVVTMFQDDDTVFAAMRAGARGYLLKDARGEEVLQAIRTVAAGGAIFSPGVAERLIAYFANVGKAISPRTFSELTEREEEILMLIAQGKNNRDIAAGFSLSLKTVQNHVSNILTKLQVADRAQAILRAQQAGLGKQA